MPTLSDHLTQSVYVRIPLQCSGVGHFHLPAMLRGRAVSVLVDSGADCTLIDLALARELGLKLSLMPQKGAGAGSAAMDVYTVDDARLEFEALQVRSEMLIAMDLSQANAAMVAQGHDPVEAIMGVDVPDAHVAVIDYGSQSLLLKT